MTESGRNYTLLLVDDNPTNLLLLVKIIELDLPEVRVLTARSGAEGLELAAKEKIDGAFIDVQMPNMSGLEMCRQLNESPQTAGIPLVLMTAHLAAPELRAEGLEVGAYDFISQPISNVEMLARIKVMLRLCANERQLRPSDENVPEQTEDRSLKLRWISGLLISGEGTNSEPDSQLLQRLAGVLPAPTHIDELELFDTLISHLPVPWRKTLLKLSLLDSIPVELGQMMGEINDVEAVFRYLHRHDLVSLSQHSGGNHLAFKSGSKEFLREKAEQILDPEELRQVYLVAAEWFQQSSDIVVAIGCLLAAKEFQTVSQLLSQFGLTLLDKTDAVDLLLGIDKIPDSIAARCGWISLFRGIHDLLNLNDEAGVWLELSHQIFEAVDNDRGRLLTLLYQVYLTLCLDGCYERWELRLPLFKSLSAAHLTVLEPSERVRLIAARGHAKLFFEGHLETIESELENGLIEAQRQQLNGPQLDINILRAVFELQRGRYLVARTALEQGFKLVAKTSGGIRNSVLQLTACEILHAEGDLEGFRRQQKLQKQSQGASANQGNFAPLLGYYEATLLLARGENKAALELLDIARLDSSVVVDSNMQSRFLQARGLCHALNGYEDRALEDMDGALQSRQKIGGIFPRLEAFLFAGITCATLNRYDQAQEYLTTGLRESLKTGEERYRIGLYAWSAFVYDAQGKAQEADNSLKLYCDLFRQQRNDFFWGLTPELLSFMVRRLTQESRHQLSSLYQKYLFSACDQLEVIPLLRVYALGGFQLQIGEQVFDLSQVGQASRQIFALLMISPKRSMSLEVLMGLLWPESSASRARNSLDTAHSRLRKALEGCFGKQVRKHYLQLEKGMLSLRNIWIDSDEVEKLVSLAQYGSQRGHVWQAENALWKVDTLWGGEFLAGFELAEDVQNKRNKLNQQRLEQLELLACLLAERQQQDEAVQLLLLGLQSDPTRDSLIRPLLAIYQERKDSRAVGGVLEHYREALAKEEYGRSEIDEMIDALGVQRHTLK
jgi:DNA-binding response OmpR family regulator